MKTCLDDEYVYILYIMYSVCKLFECVNVLAAVKTYCVFIATI